MVRIRAMAEADITAVSELHVDSWRHAYAGLIPQSYLDGLSGAENAERRYRRFAAADSRVEDLVAEDSGGAVIGWACLGPYRGEDGDGGGFEADGELYALYLRPGLIGRGVGRALADAVVERATTRGFRSLRLWVLEGNGRARRFYERAGFAPDGGAEPFTVAGVDVPEVRYALPLGPRERAA